ncbi:hypothetical protein CANCADRAFT_26554 [Tortispora caseinolytica NRRL Y-17796]|uniref:Transcription initiation factor TFIID subunit 10 n=1 Tax=Tortispora caseinolytica NRRL Y-17796 TaxID=767744 RepID=A0A1E4TGS4_9ASCO|nr:hypothetical protein CANCADRAFT_26554 [Tortispora caseinolytica NRRL Y-17796]
MPELSIIPNPEEIGELPKDKTLKELLNSMEDQPPVIPDAITDYYLMKSGFASSDKRIKRLLALATQKFITDIATDAYQYSRIRMQLASSNSQQQANTKAKITLTLDDLSSALAEYGVDIRRPAFYR